MDVTRKSCRLCLSESEFNVSLFGNFCRKVNLINKIHVCLKIDIEKTDILNTICYKCAENIERYYDFIIYIRESQTKFPEKRENGESSLIKRHLMTSYVREQVYDADYTFSFLDMPNEEKPEKKASSPFFSCFSPPNALLKRSSDDRVWKTPQRLYEGLEKGVQKRVKKQCKSERPRHHSKDLFESQSQDIEEESRTFDWKLTPDDNIMKRIRDKCFERSDF